LGQQGAAAQELQLPNMDPKPPVVPGALCWIIFGLVMLVHNNFWIKLLPLLPKNSKVVQTCQLVDWLPPSLQIGSTMDSCMGLLWLHWFTRRLLVNKSSLMQLELSSLQD